MLNELELTGRARTHVVQRDDLRAALHADVLDAWLALCDAAARDGIRPVIVSAFRDFESQQRIWNLKFAGERPLYDAAGNARDYASLTQDELLGAILCWSALPGGSRHHWGSEIDVIDAAAMPEGYRVQLLPEEAAPGGVFSRLHQWLDERMAEFGFYRPYATFRGGVHPEPWHLSFAAVSRPALAALTPDVLADAIAGSAMQGKELVLESLGALYRRYVVNVDDAPSGIGLA